MKLLTIKSMINCARSERHLSPLTCKAISRFHNSFLFGSLLAVFWMSCIDAGNSSIPLGPDSIAMQRKLDLQKAWAHAVVDAPPRALVRPLYHDLPTVADSVPQSSRKRYVASGIAQ
jgi:hypothetical protein